MSVIPCSCGQPGCRYDHIHGNVSHLPKESAPPPTEQETTTPADRGADNARELLRELAAVVDEMREHRFNRRDYGREDGWYGADVIARVFDVMNRAMLLLQEPYNFPVVGNLLDNMIDGLEYYRPLLAGVATSQPKEDV